MRGTNKHRYGFRAILRDAQRCAMGETRSSLQSWSRISSVTAGSLAWAGLSNCYYWIDRASGAAGVMCAQFLPFADPRALAAFAAFERAVYA